MYEALDAELAWIARDYFSEVSGSNYMGVRFLLTLPVKATLTPIPMMYDMIRIGLNSTHFEEDSD